jgi:hypothetical protein
MLTNIVACDAGDVRIGQAVTVVFQDGRRCRCSSRLSAIRCYRLEWVTVVANSGRLRTRSRQPRAGMARRRVSESHRTLDKPENSRPPISLVNCGVIPLALSAKRVTRRGARIPLPHNASTDSSSWSPVIGTRHSSTNYARSPTAPTTIRSTLLRLRFGLSCAA